MADFDYSSSNGRWQRLRQRALRRDGYRCQESIRYGRIVEATHVHHIWPAEEYPEFAYCLWNLVSLSKGSHDAMHDRITRKLTALGLRWKNRTRPPWDRQNLGRLQLGGELLSHAAEKFPAEEKRPGKRPLQVKSRPRAWAGRGHGTRMGTAQSTHGGESMAKEQVYKQQLQSLGVYDPAFDGAIHILCIQERELSRAMKAWKATAPSPKDPPSITDPLYAEISKLRRDILARQDALGLTPKGLQRLRRQVAPQSETAPPPASGNAAFGELLNTFRTQANGKP